MKIFSLILFFFISLFSFFAIINFLEDRRIEVVLEKHTSQIKSFKNMLTYQQTLTADINYQSILNNKEFIKVFQDANIAKKNNNTKKLDNLRQKAETLLNTQYNNIKKRGVLHYQFAFPDNISFLRMHKPSIYGDDLSTVRADIVFSNKELKPIKGFVQGKISHGFRNVYPIIDKANNHLGAVDISFKSTYLQSYFNDIANIHTHFLVKKNIFESIIWEREDQTLKYYQSRENSDYMVALPKNHLSEYNANELDPKLEKVARLMKEGNPFSVYLKQDGQHEVLSFYPIKHAISQDIVGWIVSYEPDILIRKALSISNIMYGLTTLILIVIFAFIYFIYSQKELLGKLVAEKTLELKNLNSFLEEKVKHQTKDLQKKTTQLEDSEFRWKFAVDGNGNGLWDWNIEKNELYLSPGWKEMIGFQDDEIKNDFQEWKIRVHPDDLERTLKNIDDHLKGKKSKYSNEHRLQCKDDTYKWILVQGVVVNRDENGNPLRMIGTHTDIEDRKEIEFETIKANKKFGSLFKYSLDPILLLDYETQKFTDANPKAFELYGYSKEEFLNLGVNDIEALFDEATVLKTQQTIFKRGWDQFETQHKIKSGEIINVIVNIVALKLFDKNYLYVTVKDITSQKKVDQELKASEEKAQKANIAKSEFLANMSHEIRTPINGIIGLTDIVLDTPLDAMQKDYLEKSKQSSKSLLNIINDILDYSKIEAGKLDIVKERFSLNELLNNVSNLFGYKISYKGLEFNFTVDININNIIVADSLRITQVLNNFIGNAIKFTQEGYIHIDVILLEKTDQTMQLEFRVIDTGIGIAKKNQEKLFKAFNQEDSSTTKNYGGTGLGLAISKQLIELMDGEIFFTSIKDEGSTFGFRLNVEYEEEIINSIDHKVELNDAVFLIVDDNEIDREYLSKILQSWQIDSFQAKDGLEGYESIKKNNIDYLLLDWYMPKIDGLTLLDKLKQENIDIPHILMVTAYNKKELVKNAELKNIPINKILEKPYTPSTLYNVLFDKELNILDNKESKMIKLKQRKKALLVEDNETNQIVANKILENIGFKVDTVDDGVEAVSITQKNSYDIIFMDLQMPNMDGFEATRRIRDFNKEIPIIALSAAVMQKDKELTMQAGMNDHLAKPIVKEKLEGVIRKYFQIKNEKVKHIEISHDVPPINGIDLNLVIESFHGEIVDVLSMYAKFARDYKEIEKLETFSFDSKEFEQYIHKLKGVSGNLRITKVHELAKAINDEKKTELLSELILHTKQICKDINDMLIPILESINQDNPSLDPQEIKDTIKKLIKELEGYEYIDESTIIELLNDLKDHVSQNKLEALRISFDESDNERLIEELQDIFKEIA